MVLDDFLNFTFCILHFDFSMPTIAETIENAVQYHQGGHRNPENKRYDSFQQKMADRRVIQGNGIRRENLYSGINHPIYELIKRCQKQIRKLPPVDARRLMLVENRVSRNKNRVYTSTFLLSHLRPVQLRSLWRCRITDFHQGLSTK